MGKKRVAEKTKDELLKDGAKAVVASEDKAGDRISRQRRYGSGRVYVHASYNNTIITVTSDKGEVIAWMSAGTLGFSGPKKSTPFAASKVAEAVAEKVQKTGPFDVEVVVRGVGSGRDAAVKALANKGFTITAIRDVTPVPHNGPRPPKPRRV